MLAGSIAEIPRMNRGMTVRGGMTVKQFVIPLRVSGILDLYRDDGCRLATNIKKFTK
ncbi:hypothetical protein [Wolbachia endosymbiont of Aedes albopictus]|uniref:hypothetical protein n=1 Tax=Wolbachia endosymbiont of Aedes albopictus TaxID=167957 RepID=UPI002168957E|nr:hypothetical protein [Wolbachia endosymbiont of Aedes albopictus]UVW84117.1 hypothetical protein NHG98_01185 [Wolbachia endosymbiont of Aedes albopictus]